MRFRPIAAFLVLFCIIQAANAMTFSSDINKKEAKYKHQVAKEDEKEKYERALIDRHPTGYMTVEEYEQLSAPVDKMEMSIDIPKTPTPYQWQYIPKPTYKLTKFNNPPGSPEITITQKIYKNWQQNTQGIVAPDFEKMVYSAVYYYPNTGSTACDLFIIKLEDAKTNIDKVLTANVMHRIPTPILTTTKDNDNYYTFRTITPIDFSNDSKLLLAKEKIGNTKDGIWKTTPYVYDFDTQTSYSLQDVRNAIEYYWLENSNLKLNDKRWDITPLGFRVDNQDIVVVKGIAYTGDIPVNLGIWEISSHGESPRLISLNADLPEISMNGLRMVVDGLEPKMITKMEEKQLKHMEKLEQKREKEVDKAELKEMKIEYKTKIKELNTEFKESQKDYDLRQRINSTTSENEALEKYREIKEQQAIKKQQQLERMKEKELRNLEKQKKKEEKAALKASKKNINTDTDNVSDETAGDTDLETQDDIETN